MCNFCHLHTHNEYSLLDGLGRAKQSAEQAALYGQEAIATTNHGSISGALEHYEECLKVGVKPILGEEFYFQPDLNDEENKKGNHLIIHAKNWNGWQNLIRLSSEAYRSGFKQLPISYKPVIDYRMLEQYAEDLICTTACINSYPNQLLLEGDKEGAIREIRKLQEIFGDDLFCEIMPHDLDLQQIVNNQLVGISNDLGIPLIATVDAHYPYDGWHDTHDIMLMNATGQSFEKRQAKKDKGEDVYKFECETLWMMPEEEVRSLFAQFHPDLPESVVDSSIKNTMELVNRVETFEISKDNKMPKIEEDSESVIFERCKSRLRELFPEGIPKSYSDRVDYELDVMAKMDVLDYMYIIMDAIDFANSEGILVGPGRGSSAGSLICYLTGITKIDPFAYNLLFERFLNPERVSMPDIDTDFQHDRVHEVIEYLKCKYGEDRVMPVCGFQTFQPKAAIKAISKVYDVPYGEVDSLTKLMDDKIIKDFRTIEECEEYWPEVKSYLKKYPEIKLHGERILGCVSHSTEHASAVVLMDRPINDFMPTMVKRKDGELYEVTAWSDKSDFPIISNYGMLKIDALSIKNLSIQGHALRLVKENRGEDVDLLDLDVFRDPYGVDQKVMDAFGKGHVVGVWQFSGSEPFKALIKNIKPENMHHIAAANALIRPGVSKFMGDYIARKNGREPVQYFHPDAEEILDFTYGIILYQEQVMEIVKKFAGFTGGEADTLRKVMGKEYRRGMRHVLKFLSNKGYEKKFKDGAAAYGLDEYTSDQLWQTIVGFGEYSFNASHAYAYGMISYQDMWVKMNYPQEFYTALLTEHSKKINEISREMALFDIKLSPPDVNHSDAGFSILGDKILFGLEAIKGIGEKAVEIIYEKRPYKSVEDFIERTPRRPISRKVITALEISGAFDKFGAREDYSEEELLAGEVEILGIPLSKENLIYSNVDLLSSYIENEEELAEVYEGYNATLGGEIDRVTVTKTKKGDEMAFADLTYLDNNWSVTIFPEAWANHKESIYQGASVMIKGKKNSYNGRTGYILNYLMPLDIFIKELNEINAES